MKCKPINTCSNGCPIELPGECVFYNGPDTSFLEIPSGTNINDIIVGIDDYLATLQEKIDAFEYQDLVYVYETGELSITHGNSVFLPIPVNADWNSSSGLSEILNKPVFAEVAFSGDFNDLINIPPVVIPNLQLVTNSGNITTNPLISSDASAETYILAENIAGSNTSSVRIVAEPDTPSLQFQAPGLMWIDRNGLDGQPSDLHFTHSLGAVTSNIIYSDGRMSGAEAANSNEFITLSQIAGLGEGTVTSVGISSTDLTVSGSPITTSGSINLTISNNAVTYAKMQDVTASRIIGRYSAGSGDPQEIQIGSGLSLNTSTGVLTAAGTGGTVTSVGLTMPSVFSVANSPITTTGTLGVTFASGQVANQVLATPNGSTGAVALRYLVAADIPNLDTSKLTTGILPIARGGTNTGTIGTAGQLARVNAGATALEYFTAPYISGNQTITLSGDVTGSGTTAITTTIANDAVTFAKIQNITASRLLGRYTASTGDAQEIQIGTGLNLNTSTGILTNSSPDQTVALTGASGVSITGTYPNFTITGPGATGSFILNGTSPQTANFNISGNGTIGGTTTTDTLTSSTGNDLNINTPAAQMMSFNIGSTDIMHITTDGAAIGGIIPNSARSAPLEVAGNIWSEDAFILGLSGSSTPRSEYGLSGANDAFVRMMNTGNLDLITNASTVIARVNGTTENFEVMNQIKIAGGTPGVGKVLMDADGTGLGEWTTIGGGTGTVTSVGISSTDLSVSGSPITTSGSITLNVNNDSITYAKMQNMTQARLLGRYTASTGDPQEIQIGTGLNLNSGTGVLSNSLPDQTVVLSNGTGISVTGTYPNFTITNISPNADQDLDSVLTEGNSSSQGITVGSVVTGSVNSGGPGTLALGANTVDTILISSSGNSANITGSLGINTSSPSEALEITGNALVSGTVTASGGGFNSSRILKEDIREFSKSALNIVSKIPIVQFKYKTNKNNTIGFIADEVPEEVLIDGQEAMDIYSTIGLLIKSIQELNEKIDGLGITIK